MKDWMVRKANRKALLNMQSFDFENCYVNWIDDETCAFIVAHSEHDLLLRKQDYLNWQLKYPFVVSTGDDPKQEIETCKFGGYVNRLSVQMIQVFVGGVLCGFYVLNTVNSICTVLYLYYEEKYGEQVFASLSSIVLCNDELSRLRTFNKDLFDFMCGKGVKSMHTTNIDKVSLTVPSGFVVDSSLHLQGGDGDMVC